MKKIEDRQVISREEFHLYEKHDKFETYTKDWYPFKCPKCSDSYDVIIRGNTADEKIIHIIYVEDEKEEKTCSVPPEFKRLFLGLEPGKTYEFSISRSRTKCFVSGAVEIEQ